MMSFARFRILLLGLALTATGILFSLQADAQVYNRFGPANGILKGNTSTYVTTAAAASDVISLWTGTCNSSSFLRGDGNCAAAGGGTVTSIAAGTGITATPSSPITTSGTLAIDQSFSPTWLGIHTFDAAYTNFTQDDVDLTGAAGFWRFHQDASNWSIDQCDSLNSTCVSKLLFSAINNNTTLGSGGDTTISAGDDLTLTVGGELAVNGDAGTTGQVLTSNGAGVPPTWEPATGGTVTSVALTMPSGFSVSGSPVTSSGTLGVTTSLNGVLRANGSGFTTATSANIISLWTGTCTSSSEYLAANGTCQTVSAGASGANPTATIGLSAVNGSAGTFMRSDGAPALSQAIAPTWTAQHTFTLDSTATPAINLSSIQPVMQWNETDAAADNKRWVSSANAEQFRMQARSDDNATATTFLAVDRTGTTVDSIALTATAVTVNGQNVCRADGTGCPGGTQLTVFKAANTSRASTTTLADDPDLTIAIPSTGIWLVELLVSSAEAGTGAELKMGLNYTGTTTDPSVTTAGINIGSVGGSATGIRIRLATSGTGDNISVPTLTAAADSMKFTAVMNVATTGTLSLQWSQQNTSASATYVLAGSYMTVRKLN